MSGRIAQIETMGLFDGPGIRIVLFMQGCSLRCLYCHNPEMWKMDGGNEYTPEEVINIILKYKNYFGTEGGVTFSGGEPLMQPQFLLECLKLCKNMGITTCIDTAGVGDEEYYQDILKYVDLVIYDIKALEKKQYEYITNNSIDKTNKFFNLCQKLNKPMWIRSVIVPGINDNEDYINSIADFLKDKSNIERIELLPYHTMGINKYKELGIEYPLSDCMPMDIDKCKELERKINELI